MSKIKFDLMKYKSKNLGILCETLKAIAMNEKLCYDYAVTRDGNCNQQA